MYLITWNIQWARGADGVVDPKRIIRVCREMADFDVLCFQEVARNFPGLAGNGGADVFAQLAAELPGYAPHEGLAVVALGVVVAGARAPVRITTTHLEYYSAKQRAAQVERLRELHAEAAPHAADR